MIKNPFFQGLFASSSANMSQQKGKLTFETVGSKFKTKLGKMIDNLKSTVNISLIHSCNIYMYLPFKLQIFILL